MTWQINPAQTRIQFSVRHMLISKVRGQFKKFGGTIDFDEQNPANTTVHVTIDVASIYTGDKQRDEYLRSSGFLDAAEYPQLTFVGKRVQQINASYGRLIGDLTIQGITHEVTLNVRRTDKSRGPKAASSARFQAKTRISRKAWGLEWNAALEAGGWLVGDKINIDIKIEIVKNP